jgi:parallel beta-helix repeat protein
MKLQGMYQHRTADIRFSEIERVISGLLVLSLIFVSLIVVNQVAGSSVITISLSTGGTVRVLDSIITVNQSGDTYSAWFATNDSLFKSSTSLGSLVGSIVARLTNGGEVYFKQGTYASFDQWNVNNRNIELIAESGTIVDFQTVKPMNAKESNSGILISADGVSVQGFTIINCDKAGIKVRDVKHITIKDNNVFNTWSGIVLESVNDTIIKSNWINLTQGDGIYVTGDASANYNCKNVTVESNQVNNVGDTGIDVSNGGSAITFVTINVINNKVNEYNSVSRSSTPNGMGLTISSVVDTFIVQGNVLENLKSGALINGFNGVATSNQIINFGSGSGIWGNVGTNVKIELNQIYSSPANWAVSTNKAWIIENNRLTVNGHDGDSAIYAPNAIKQNNTAYSP